MRGHPVHILIICFFSIDRSTQSGIYNKWKSDSVKSGGYNGRFEEHKLDLNEQFEFTEISVTQLKGELYLLIVGTITAILILASEFCLKDRPEWMLFSYNHDNYCVKSKIFYSRFQLHPKIASLSNNAHEILLEKLFKQKDFIISKC